MRRRALLAAMLCAPLAIPTASAERFELPDFMLDAITGGKILENNQAVQVIWKFYEKNKKTWGSFKLTSVSVNRNDMTINKGKNSNRHFNSDLVQYMQRTYDTKYRIAK